MLWVLELGCAIVGADNDDEELVAFLVVGADDDDDDDEELVATLAFCTAVVDAVGETLGCPL